MERWGEIEPAAELGIARFLSFFAALNYFRFFFRFFFFFMSTMGFCWREFAFFQLFFSGHGS